MKTNIILIACLGIVAFFSSVVNDNPQLKQAEWLIGTWENQSQRGTIYEKWSKISDLEFSGKSFALAENDTIVFETLQLIEKQDGIFYIPTVKNQNDGQPVSFSLKKISETELFFENPEHDFPQYISYTRVLPDSLIAEISGMRGGQERKITFRMRKVEK